MKRGARLCLVAALTLSVSGVYGLHPRGIALSWQLLVARAELSYGLLLLSQLAIIWACLRFAGAELAAYRRWRAGVEVSQDTGREAAWAVALHRFGTPAQVLRALPEAIRAIWFERRRTVARAKRRWPRKKQELAGWLAQAWSGRIRLGVGLVVGGEALTCYLSYRIPGYTLSPVLSLGAAVVGMAVGNALMLLAWVAGDDDDGGSRSRPPLPRPTGGHTHSRPKRQIVRPALRVQGSNKQGVRSSRFLDCAVGGQAKSKQRQRS